MGIDNIIKQSKNALIFKQTLYEEYLNEAHHKEDDHFDNMIRIVTAHWFL